MINRWIGDYRITNYLGRGDGLELYRAIRPEAPGVRHLVKRIPRGEVDSETFLNAFTGLARQRAALDHPLVLRLDEILFDDEAAYLLGEYLHGHSLAALIDPDGMKPIPHAAGLFTQAAEAVAASHSVGLLHGGLTVHQILYAQEKYVKVDGFGLPTVLRELGLPGGEPAAGYLAPELDAAEPPTIAGEIFALGAVLTHLLTGRAPEPIGNGKPPVSEQLIERRSDLPERLVEMVRRATTPDLAERYRSVDELREHCADPAVPAPAADAGALPAVGDLPEWTHIPAGPFLMGSDRRKNEGPVHPLELPAYEIAATPTTNRQYRRFCGETGHARPDDPPGWENYFEACPDHPVINVNWKDAGAYCKWLSSLTDSEVRLPVEAEWEKAARGGLEAKFYPWGDEQPDGRAHFGNRIYAWEITMDGPQSRRVGCFAPNGYGLYDMAGNVWEWCDTWYTPYGAPQPRAAVFRVIRGGTWAVGEDSLHCSFRMSVHHSMGDFFIGFRCVRSAR